MVTQKKFFLWFRNGDKITDYFTYQQIDKNYTLGQPSPSGEIVYGKDKIYSYITIVYDDQIFIEDFSQSGIQIYYENETDKIVSIGKVETTFKFKMNVLLREIKKL